jgi:hypothetical protein
MALPPKRAIESALAPSNIADCDFRRASSGCPTRSCMHTTVSKVQWLRLHARARARSLARSQLCGTHRCVDCAAAKAARPGPGTYELPSAFGSQQLSSRSTSAVRPPLSSPAAAVGIHRSPYVALACCTLCLTPSLGLPLRCVAARPHPALAHVRLPIVHTRTHRSTRWDCGRTRARARTRGQGRRICCKTRSARRRCRTAAPLRAGSSAPMRAFALR